MAEDNNNSETTPLHKKDKKAEPGFAKKISVFGIWLVCVIIVCFSLACVQVLDGAVPPFELNAWRFGIQLIFTLPVIGYNKWDVKMDLKKIPLQAFVAIMINLTNIFYFTAAEYIPVGEIAVAGNCTIITLTSILSICVKDQRKLPLYLGAGLAIVGMVLMFQPNFLFKGAHLPPPPEVNWTSPCVPPKNVTPFDNSTEEIDVMLHIKTHLPSYVVGYILVVLYAVSTTSCYYAIKPLVVDVNSSTVAFWNALIGTILSIVIMLIMEKPTFPHSWFCIMLLFFHCVGTSQQSIFMPWALQYLSAAIVVMVSTTKIIFLLVLQYTLLHHIMPGLDNWVQVVGGVICFCGLIGGPLCQLLRERYKEKEEAVELAEME